MFSELCYKHQGEADNYWIHNLFILVYQNSTSLTSAVDTKCQTAKNNEQKDTRQLAWKIATDVYFKF